MLFALLPDVLIHASDRKILFDKNWKFHRGIVANAEQPEYNDNNWRVLDLPHDWSVEPLPMQREGITVGPFSRMSQVTLIPARLWVAKDGIANHSPFPQAMLINALFSILREHTINPNFG